MFKSRLATLFIVVLVLSACSATYTDKADKGIYFYQKGKVVQSRANFNRELAGSIDDHLFKLERGMTFLADTSPKAAQSAVNDFTKAGNKMERMRKGRTTWSVASYLLDDTVRDYVAMPFEQVAVKLLTALSYMRMPNCFEDVSAACRDMDVEMEKIEAFFKVRYKHDKDGNQPNFSFKVPPVAKYVASIAAEQRGETDNALIYLSQAINQMPRSNFLMDQLYRIKSGKKSRLVYVLSLLGTAPRKYEIECDEDDIKDLMKGIETIYKLVDPATRGNFQEEAFTLPILIPAYAPRTYFWHGGYSIKQEGGSRSVDTECLADFDLYARKEFKKIGPQILMRAVIRRAVKMGISKLTRMAITDDQRYSSLVEGLINLALTSTETIDTRSWLTLPREFHVACLPYEKGSEKIILTRKAPGGSLLKEKIEVDLDMKKQGPAFVLVIHPSPSAEPIVIVDQDHMRTPQL